MYEAKTVGSSDMTLLSEQMKDVANMRTSLLSFNKSDPQAASKAIRNITLLRVYHQLERIVRYTEMMDTIEDRIYQSLNAKLQESDPDDSDIWMQLIPIQEKLQRSMVESHKLLEPYLSADFLTALEAPQIEDPAASFTSMILDQEGREKVRTGIQELLGIMSDIDSQQIPEPEKAAVKNKAQEALAELATAQGE